MTIITCDYGDIKDTMVIGVAYCQEKQINFLEIKSVETSEFYEEFDRLKQKYNAISLNKLINNK